MSTIPLAKGFSEKHLNWPVLISIKYDGVPVRIDIDHYGNYTCRTRQGKPVSSVSTLVQEFVDRYVNDDGDTPLPVTFVGEVVQHDNHFADFKVTSGIVRKQEDQSHRLAIALFECDIVETFIGRHEWMEDWVSGLHGRVHVVPQIAVENMDQLVQHQQEFNRLFPQAEGLVARNHDDPFAPGKRSWGYQKVLNEPTIDLRIVGVEEAIDQHGQPKGMAGRLVASYKGNRIGIGPGRLTHAERVELWEQYKQVAECCCCGDPIEGHSIGSGHSPVSMADYYEFPNSIAQIKYKKDDSYDALRQPTFQFWRDDKETPDA